MTDWKPDVCVYHGNCDDGFGAAWAIWKRWPGCRFIPGFYGKALPIDELVDKHVLFVDFSAKYDVLVDISFKAHSTVVIDHHKTAQADLSRLPPFNGAGGGLRALDLAFQINRTQNTPDIAVWFDMDRSGAVMAWDFAHGIDHNDSPPRMLAYIQDRDLWRFAFGDKTKQFSAALRTYPMDFATWDEIAYDPDALIDEGKIVLRSHQANLQKILTEAYRHRIGDYVVPVVNAPYHYASDAAHELLIANPAAPFAASWFRRADGKIQWSLRSEDSRADVSSVAKSMGGGGHRNAAGFETPA